MKSPWLSWLKKFYQTHVLKNVLTIILFAKSPFNNSYSIRSAHGCVIKSIILYGMWLRILSYTIDAVLTLPILSDVDQICWSLQIGFLKQGNVTARSPVRDRGVTVSHPGKIFHKKWKNSDNISGCLIASIKSTNKIRITWKYNIFYLDYRKI